MALFTTGLSTFRWNNSWKSLALVAVFPIVTFWLFRWQVFFIQAWLHAKGQGGRNVTAADLHRWTDDIVYGWGGLAFGTSLVLWLLYAWRQHASVIRGLTLARPVTAEEEPHLYALLEALCISQGLPTPELEIIETPARNSFVCDIDGELSRIFVTRGLLEHLSSDEIEAVLAHEIAHILNGDNRLLSFSIAFCDLYPVITRVTTAPAFHEAPNETRRQINPVFLLHPVLFVVFLPLWGGYVVTSVLRVLLFIRRELDADATAVEITKNADALMRALLRISRRARIPFLNHDIKFMCIDNPAGGVFSTHPRLSTRLRALSQITGTPIPAIEPATSADTRPWAKSSLLKRSFRSDTKLEKGIYKPWL